VDEQAEMRLHYSLPEFDLNFAFSPLDFTQVNPSVNQQMVQLACELLQLRQGERVLDLFCGLGNFTLPLARCVGDNWASGGC
jgi:23S rRNA (uracil1939-C5)-methyltransferase